MTSGGPSGTLRASVVGSANGARIQSTSRERSARARFTEILMANTPKWNVRLRHEWLQSPLKKKRVKKNEKIRSGLYDAEQRKLPKGEAQA